MLKKVKWLCIGFFFLLLIGSISVRLGCLSFFDFAKEKVLLSTKQKISQDSPLPIKQNSITQLIELPLYFEKNEGQTDASVFYYTQGQGHAFYFTPQKIAVVLCKKSQEQDSYAALNIQFIGVNSDVTPKGLEEQVGKSHYFIGNDPQKWHRNISHYAKVCYEELYPGIDAIFYGNHRQLEYDICIQPGANPQAARLRIEGAKELSLDPQGHLHIVTADEQELQMQKPLIYQSIEGKKQFIEGEFRLLACDEVGFKLGEYDNNHPLIIDPILVYSTYLGGSNDDLDGAIALDSTGHAYLTGQTQSLNFPVTAGAFGTILPGPSAAFVTKLNPTGSDLIYSTYLGGNGDNTDRAVGIAVDSSGNAYIVGQTTAPNFPTTLGAFQTTLAGTSNAFIAKLNPTGSDLIYSTYLGGSASDAGSAIAIDESENAYVTGLVSSADFPTTPGAFQTMHGGNFDAFVTKLNSTGSALIYSTYLGGTDYDIGESIAVDSSGNAYVVGPTTSTNFPITVGAFQTIFQGNDNGFVTKLDPTGSTLIYSTYLGGSLSSVALGIALDNNGNAYVTGSTSSINFPTTAGAFQTTLEGNNDGFVTKLNTTGSALVYSTYLGGNMNDAVVSIALDSNENAYLVGYTQSTNFPVTPGAIQSTLLGSQNAFVAKLNPTGSSLIYSTYLGGSNTDEAESVAIDSNGNTYLIGQTNSTDFPTTVGAFQTTLAGNNDVFIAQLALGTPSITSVSPNSGPPIGGTIVTITGINFNGTLEVLFGSTPATIFSVDSDTQITAISPPHVVGNVDITIVAAGGTSVNSPADAFTYFLIPTSTTTILSAAPSPVAVGQPVNLTATVSPSSATGIVSFFDGSVLIGTASLSNGTTVLTTSFLTAGSHILTAVYQGDPVFSGSTSSPVTLLVDAASLVIFPPTHLRGRQETNRFATQTEYFNVLHWKAPSNGIPPVAYRIYRDKSLTDLAGVVPARGKLQFKDHNRQKDKTYTYFIVSVSPSGTFSIPATIKIKGEK